VTSAERAGCDQRSDRADHEHHQRSRHGRSADRDHPTQLTHLNNEPVHAFADAVGADVYPVYPGAERDAWRGHSSGEFLEIARVLVDPQSRRVKPSVEPRDVVLCG